MTGKPLSDLEMYEVICLAYPEKFDENLGEDIWDDVQDFAGEISGWDEIADLLGRVTMLTIPIKSNLTGQLSHRLGKVIITDSDAKIISAVKREVSKGVQ